MIMLESLPKHLRERTRSFDEKTANKVDAGAGDHCLYELVVVQAFIGEAKSEEIAGSIDCLIARFVEAENRGWILFDPNVRLA